MKKILVIMLTFVLLLTMVACSQKESNIEKTDKEESNKIITIQFGELMDQDYNVSKRIKELDGKEVSMIGFMAMQSPLDGSFIYLTNAPLVSCPYCAPGTNTPIYTIPVMAPTGKPITYTEQPVTITGKLEVKDKTNEFGHTTPFRINAASIAMADTAQISQSLKEYTMLASDGVVMDILMVLDQVVAYACYELSHLNPDMIYTIDIQKIDELINKVQGYGISSFDTVVDVLQRTKDLAIVLNKLIENDEKEKMISYSEKGLSIWDAYFDWADKMATIE